MSSPAPRGRRLHRWVPALRLARRDAVRHRARTILSTLLVAVPMAAIVVAPAIGQTPLPSRDAAFTGIPIGAQGILTATAVNEDSAPFEQIPEGSPGPWLNDPSQAPAPAVDLARSLDPTTRFLPYWDSSRILAATGLDLRPGEQEPAGAGDIDELELGAVTAMDYREAGADALAMLLPDLEAGTLPTDPSEAVVSRALADRLRIGVGDTVSAVAPPPEEGYGMDGRMGEVVADSQRGLRVSGIAPGTREGVWALDGWVSAMVDADPVGLDLTWLVTGAPVTWDQAKQLNALQAFVVSRHVLEDYPAAGELYPVPVDPEARLLTAVAVVLAAAAGVLLVLFLVTPAFAVAINQSRRTLGLASVAGAAPRDLRRMIAAQGLVVGALGATTGIIVGVPVAVWLRGVVYPDADPLSHFPWWTLPVVVVVATLLGLVATWFPARAASRLQPVDAIKDRPSARGRNGSRGRRRLLAVAGPVLLAVSVALAVWSLALPVPTGADIDSFRGGRTESADVAPQLTLLVGCVLTGVLGVVVCVLALPGAGARRAARFPLAPRLAMRGAADHPSRFLPAVLGVLVAVGAASSQAIMVGSTAANGRDQAGYVTQERIMVGVSTHVTEDLDRLAVADTLAMLGEEYPIAGSEPLYTIGVDAPVFPNILLPVGETCPPRMAPDTASAIEVGVPTRCVPYQTSYDPGQVRAWGFGADPALMDAPALRASGIPGTEEAAEVLDLGGVVVNNAAYLSDAGTVRVGVSDTIVTQLDESDAEFTDVVELPGAFVRGLWTPLVMTPQTARGLGITGIQYVGEYALTPPLTDEQVARAQEMTLRHTTLTSVSPPAPTHAWGASIEDMIPVVALVLLAILATVICLALSRTQALREFATMRAVGAAPGFLRRLGLAQAGAILVVGVPAGMVAGLALGAYRIAWNRRTSVGGAWLETVPMWGVQGAILLAVVGAGLAAALLAFRPRR